jgi:cytochrome P450
MLEDPFPLLKHLRADQPVALIPGRDAYLVTRREDVEYVVMNPELFSSQGRSPTQTYPNQRYETLPDLASTDPPDHTAMRAAHVKMFSPKRLAAMKPGIEAEANRLIDQIEGAGEIDLITKFAKPLPLWVMTQLLGLPGTMQSQLGEWADNWFTLFDANLHNPEGFNAEEELVASYVEFMNFCGDLVQERMANLGDDSLSVLLQSTKPDGTPFTIDQYANFARLLIVGSQTTETMLAHAVIDVLRLDEVPDLSDSRTARAYLDESMRLDGPTTYGPRICTTDVEVGGVAMSAGTRILLSWQSANRDAEFHHEPEQFDPERENLARHMSFGHGIHRCIGASLAYAEGEIALRVLFERLPHLRLSERNDFQHVTELTGIRKLRHLWVSDGSQDR